MGVFYSRNKLHKVSLLPCPLLKQNLGKVASQSIKTSDFLHKKTTIRNIHGSSKYSLMALPEFHKGF